MEIDSGSTTQDVFNSERHTPLSPPFQLQPLHPRQAPTFQNTQQLQLVNCCICGILIPANPVGTCNNCLKDQVDATAGIERNLVMPYCKHCNRYQRPPWLPCEWESRELLALCLKRIRGLQGNRRDIRLVDAGFLYTEPHSRRIKVKLTVQKEVVASTIVEQDCIVEFVIQPTQCDDCKRAFTPHTWTAVVQIRQRVQHKRSLMYLEQIILKHNAHEKVLKVVEAPEGLDFQFSSKSNAQKFAEFVSFQLPCRCRQSKQLISHDPKSNTAFNKHTISVEVCPISKDDLVFLPVKIANNVYGGISPFLLCSRISNAIQLIDPFSLRGIDIAADKYWRFPFETLLTRRHLTEFIVLDIELIDMRTVSVAAHAQRFVNPHAKKTKNLLNHDANMMQDSDSRTSAAPTITFSDPRCDPLAGRLVDVEIARASDFGINDVRITVRSHLGQSLKVGDYCLGYDLARLNIAGLSDETGMENKLPCEAILVRKVRHLGAETRKRNWVLQRLPIEKATSGPIKGHSANHMDLEEFKRDLEEDAVMRQEVNLWKDPKCFDKMTNKEEEDAVKLSELLQGLTLEDEDDTGYTYE